MKAITKFTHYASLSLAAIVLAGCASSRTADRHPQDPLEPLNREIFSFNRGIDTIFIKPVAGVYHKFVPPQARQGVTNFFSNINDINVTANELLQFKIEDAIKTSVRFIMNTTFGIGGLFDVATHVGLYKKRQDFGTTLAFYGIKNSPYLVLPLLGPSTIRDTAGLAVDFYLSPYAYVAEDVMWTALAINYVNQRANLLEDTGFVDYAAMDPYALVRDIYLGRRNALINKKQIGNEWNSAEDKWDDWAEPWSDETATGVSDQVGPPPTSDQ